ncbi:V-ATPase E-subunit VatE [Acetobacterium paludosum]|uniref:V-ATPase E-subunit VatE n=1 Tax=Acetobacterium paludosum TaxID=52693 RepID=A0A923KXI2_9FIRM|nr:V-type ATP synthase subunit E family protein [Acetobacterium paludosum]MBC3889625.1 V-ATPase E-subunit VatE [Acetobacterium paludosum]
MISVEEKLRVFSQYLLNKERTRGKGIIEEAKSKQQELLEASKQKIEKEKKDIEERNKKIIFRDKNKIISEGKNRAKTLELEEKNHILIGFNQLIMVKAKEFVVKDVYRDYLRNCVTGIPEIFGEKRELVVFVNKNDLDYFKALINDQLIDYTVEYRQEIKDSIGGIVVEDAESRIHCDFSVENLINTKYKFIGMTLNEFMEKQVK